MPNTSSTLQSARRATLEALAGSDARRLAERFAALGEAIPGAHPLRGPETGMVMLRGRIGGGGALFNLGEAAVTRASVTLESGEVGHAMVLGREKDKASMIAHLDALAQRPDWATRIANEVIAPLLAESVDACRRQAEETQATRVDFFTMARGED